MQTKASIKQFKLTSDQQRLIMSKLPSGYTIKVNSYCKRTVTQNCPEQINNSLNPRHNHMWQKICQQQTTYHQYLLMLLRRCRSQISMQQKVSPFLDLYKDTLEEDLYSKSPNFLSPDLRKCFVVFHKLKRHYLFKNIEEYIKKNSEHRNPITIVESHLLEGPAYYTPQHFWCEMTEIFRTIYTLESQSQDRDIIQKHFLDSVASAQAIELENHFNEIFKYVHNQSRKGILSNLQKKALSSRSRNNSSAKGLNEEDLKICIEKLSQLPAAQIHGIWKIVSSSTTPNGYLSFEVEKLSVQQQRRLHKHLMRKQVLERPQHSLSPKSSKNPQSTGRKAEGGGFGSTPEDSRDNSDDN